MAGIYLHIPFCKQACSYCDFYFITRLEYRKTYVDRLIEEINAYRGSPYTDSTFETIYLGGGTPSMLPASQIERILRAVYDTFEIEPNEITMEMNPDNVTTDYLNALLDLGIQRASMGVQSFQPDLLEFMQRAHDREEALQCFELLADAGFASYSVDLIYGNPGQSLEQLERDLELLTEFDPPHVSAYSLTIEPNTRLGKQHELGRLDPLPDEKVAEHFDRVVERLEEAGIHQYEVSNFSKPGCEALHNSGYWTHKNYLGMGPSAHSFWWDRRQNRAVRWMNEPDIKSYLSGYIPRVPNHSDILTQKSDSTAADDSGSKSREVSRNRGHSALSERQKKSRSEQEKSTSVEKEYNPWYQKQQEYEDQPDEDRPSKLEILTLNQLAEERIMMGLRTREGIAQSELKKNYNYALNNRQTTYLEQKQGEGLIQSVDPIQLSKKGLKIADAMILDLVSLKEN